MLKSYPKFNPTYIRPTILFVNSFTKLDANDSVLIATQNVIPVVTSFNFIQDCPKYRRSQLTCCTNFTSTKRRPQEDFKQRKNRLETVERVQTFLIIIGKFPIGIHLPYTVVFANSVNSFKNPLAKYY